MSKISKGKRRRLMTLCDRIAVNNGQIEAAQVDALLSAFAASMRATVPQWWATL